MKFEDPASWLCCLLALAAGCAYAPRVERVENPGLEQKSVGYGVFLATVPGFFVHGLGSSYAGDARGAEDLQGQQIISLYFAISIAIGLGLDAIWDAFIRDEVDPKTRKTVDDVFLWQSLTTGPLTYGIGGYLFLSSWINDILRTPELVETWNRRRALEWNLGTNRRSPKPNGS